MAEQKLTFGQKLDRDTKKLLAPGQERRAARRAANNPGTTVREREAALRAQGTRTERRKRSAATQDYYGIARQKFGDAPRQQGQTATGKDGVTRTYDAATKTWKIQR